MVLIESFIYKTTVECDCLLIEDDPKVDDYIFICNVIMLGCSTLCLTKCSKFQVVESLEMCSKR